MRYQITIEWGDDTTTSADIRKLVSSGITLNVYRDKYLIITECTKID